MKKRPDDNLIAGNRFDRNWTVLIDDGQSGFAGHRIAEFFAGLRVSKSADQRQYKYRFYSVMHPPHHPLTSVHHVWPNIMAENDSWPFRRPSISAHRRSLMTPGLARPRDWPLPFLQPLEYTHLHSLDLRHIRLA